MIGKIISHYKIIEKLGKGGMGEVYLAEDLKLKRSVTIKFLPQHLTKDKNNVERFERGAKATAALNHPNIVTIYEIAEDEDQTFIVMYSIINENPRFDTKTINSLPEALVTLLKKMLTKELSLRISDISEVKTGLLKINEQFSHKHKAGNSRYIRPKFLVPWGSLLS
jgi:serine/threonine protein kinase